MSSPARLCRNNRYRLALKWHQPRIVIARRPQADAAISGRQLRFRRGCPVIGLGTARFPRRFAPRNDKFESLMPPNYRPNTCSCQWRSGNALQTQSVCAFLSLPCTSCKCLTPHFTRILRPAGGKNTALSGKTHIFPHVLRPKRRTMGGKPAKRITSQEKPTNAPEIFRDS